MPDLIPALRDRRARRAFAPDRVPADVQQALWRAVSLAPSHGNTQPVRLLVATTTDAHDALTAALSDGNRGWAGPAPLLVAIAAVPSHDITPENRDGSRRELWAFHAGIATGNLLAQATALGLTAHPMAGFDEASVRAVFGAPEDVRVLAVVAIGYPGPVASLPEDLQAKEEAPQERLPLSVLVVEDRWTEEHGISARELRKRQRPS
jgi:nitroreductase